MHKFGIVPSIYHQCMKGKVDSSVGRKVFTINGTLRLFDAYEAHMVDAQFLKTLLVRKNRYRPPQGIAFPKWEDVRKDNFNDQKKHRSPSLECIRVKLPNGHFAYCCL